MRFVECVDYGDVRTQIISGVASIRIVSHGEMVEIRFYESGEGADGTIECRLAARQVWSMSAWLRAGKDREAFLRQAPIEMATIGAHH